MGSGAGRGATIGVPTLNQNVVNETLPASGVYATRVHRHGDLTTFTAVTNIGINPTFGGVTEVKVETHVLDADVNWRGEVIDVDFLPGCVTSANQRRRRTARSDRTRHRARAEPRVTTEPKRWTVVSKVNEAERWRSFGERVRERGVANAFEPWSGELADLDDLETLRAYDFVRIGSRMGEHVASRLKVQSTWTTVLGVIDGMTRERGGWWPRCALYDASAKS